MDPHLYVNIILFATQGYSQLLLIFNCVQFWSILCNIVQFWLILCNFGQFWSILCNFVQLCAFFLHLCSLCSAYIMKKFRDLICQQKINHNTMSICRHSSLNGQTVAKSTAEPRWLYTLNIRCRTSAA